MHTHAHVPPHARLQADAEVKKPTLLVSLEHVIVQVCMRPRARARPTRIDARMRVTMHTTRARAYANAAQVLRLIFVPHFSSTRAAASSSAVFLIAFLVVHLLGNLLIFKGKQAFNECRPNHARTHARAATPRPARVLFARSPGADVGFSAAHRYGHTLRTNPVLTVIEVWLALAFVAHTAAALVPTRQDKKLELGSRFSWAKV